MDREELRSVLLDVLNEEMGLSAVDMGGKWEGGEIVIRSTRGTPREKVIPLESFFRKLIMVRDRLRVVEQKINSHPRLTTGEKVTLNQYITKINGTLTTFNFLFRDREDQFVGERKHPSERPEPMLQKVPGPEPLLG